jgi:dTMP kinase
VFITFEGIEGCGKSTQARRLVNRLRDASVPLVFTLEPGGTRVGREIRRVLLDSRNSRLSPLAELFLYEADRAQHVEEKIRPALEQGKWVVCDRFFDATTVYQGFARGQDMKLIRNLNEKACFGIRPDMTFLIDCPVEIGLKRALKRNEGVPEVGQDRFEREEKAFHEAVRQGYLTMAKEDPERIVVVDCKLNEDELEAVIFEQVRPFI